MAETFLFLPFTLVNYDLVYNPLDMQTLTRIDAGYKPKRSYNLSDTIARLRLVKVRHVTIKCCN